MEENLISVIVPIYNTDKYLDDCIESIVNQSYSNLEIILVNDGSTDRSQEICEKWRDKDSRICLINQSNMGAPVAKNTGLDIIKGNFFMIVDSDDILHKKNIEILYEALIKSNADVSQGNYTENFEKFNEKNKEMNIICSTKIFSTKDALKELITRKSFNQMPWNKIFKKEVLNDIRFPKGKYIDDEYWTYKLFLNAKYSVMVNTITYYYRQHENSIMGQSFSVKRVQVIDANEERHCIIKKIYPDLACVSLESFFINCIYNFQKLCAIDRLDYEGKYRKYIIDKYRFYIKSEDIKRFTLKRRILFYSFYKYPYLISRIRNGLKRGI